MCIIAEKKRIDVVRDWVFHSDRAEINGYFLSIVLVSVRLAECKEGVTRTIFRHACYTDIHHTRSHEVEFTESRFKLRARAALLFSSKLSMARSYEPILDSASL
jgi:hypothetical protein